MTLMVFSTCKVAPVEAVHLFIVPNILIRIFSSFQTQLKIERPFFLLGRYSTVRSCRATPPNFRTTTIWKLRVVNEIRGSPAWWIRTLFWR